jgi:hypothetical protein
MELVVMEEKYKERIQAEIEWRGAIRFTFKE